MPRADFITAIVLLALGAGALAESARMPRLEHLQVDAYTVPGIVPAFLSAVLLILATVLLARSILRGGWRIDRATIRGALFGTANRRLVLCLVLTIGYAAGLVGQLPYWLATGIFVFLFIALFEWTQHKPLGRSRALSIAAIEAAVVAAVVTAVFQFVFLVRLP